MATAGSSPDASVGPCLNLACGQVFVRSPSWVNIDFGASGPAVVKADLLGALPFPEGYFQVLYSSHFLEHIPLENVQSVIGEWMRVLQPGGRLRLVLPDFETLARRYLDLRDASQHAQADAVVTLIIDQCVRRNPGGQLKQLYNAVVRGNLIEVQALLTELDGVRFDSRSSLSGNVPASSRASFPSRLLLALRPAALAFRCRQWRWKLAMKLLPDAFVAQNISFASIGELHHWLWDEPQLRSQLQLAGFQRIERLTLKTSRINTFPFYPLDLNADGSARKGMQSMVVEAQKPLP